jgi:hypothetical protein
MVLPLATTSTSPTADAILEALACVYDDPNRASKAADRLTSGKIKQSSDEPFSAYLARYEKTLYEAGAQDWPDLVKIFTLRSGLEDVLKRNLEVQLAIPAEYDPFVKALHQLARSSSRGPAPSGPVKEGFKGSGYGGTKMEVDAVIVGSLDCSYESGNGKDNEEGFAEAFGY